MRTLKSADKEYDQLSKQIEARLIEQGVLAKPVKTERGTAFFNRLNAIEKKMPKEVLKKHEALQKQAWALEVAIKDHEEIIAERAQRVQEIQNFQADPVQAQEQIRRADQQSEKAFVRLRQLQEDEKELDKAYQPLINQVHELEEQVETQKIVLWELQQKLLEAEQEAREGVMLWNQNAPPAGISLRAEAAQSARATLPSQIAQLEKELAVAQDKLQLLHTFLVLADPSMTLEDLAKERALEERVLQNDRQIGRVSGALMMLGSATITAGLVYGVLRKRAHKKRIFGSRAVLLGAYLRNGLVPHIPKLYAL
jgi:DNA repair exonuclease SbcCD ATPase subunit